MTIWYILWIFFHLVHFSGFCIKENLATLVVKRLHFLECCEMNLFERNSLNESISGVAHDLNALHKRNSSIKR
jgi:hypothetical protein